MHPRKGRCVLVPLWGGLCRSVQICFFEFGDSTWCMRLRFTLNLETAKETPHKLATQRRARGKRGHGQVQKCSSIHVDFPQKMRRPVSPIWCPHAFLPRNFIKTLL